MDFYSFIILSALAELFCQSCSCNKLVNSTEDCLDPTCGGHGSCVRGRCVCRAGWRGAACSERDARVQRCLPACSQRGVYDLDAGRCVCDPLYTGDDCSQGIVLESMFHDPLLFYLFMFL